MVIEASSTTANKPPGTSDKGWLRPVASYGRLTAERASAYCWLMTLCVVYSWDGTACLVAWPSSKTRLTWWWWWWRSPVDRLSLVTVQRFRQWPIETPPCLAEFHYPGGRSDLEAKLKRRRNEDSVMPQPTSTLDEGQRASRLLGMYDALACCHACCWIRH